ncbi:Spx/MgsR family RNA polymerase-binding regulatory protein [Bacillus sp. NEB1478]|uniref:Spx/MgsR family RNA polymerase-binding regulatory protein n=1 Tax=Bacillus sp. NEB1478 TaxID=3073816 RepID=UPI002873C6CB|nr:Spx/MgsR family RNA polymerase-binding regulatory protein [Bacillus sp. NEB1478]WNB93554.1 Spx/MgsR family RNA polymerase-binding regulatory protein [Bacillus sp. NEB1478]
MNSITFYTYPSCTSCRKAKMWLKQNKVTFDERHLFKDTPSVEELREILKLTKAGTEEILAKRSQSFKSLKVDIDELSTNEMLQLLVDNPKLLKRPIVTDGTKLIAGYSPGEMKKLCRKKEKEHISSHVS